MIRKNIFIYQISIVLLLLMLLGGTSAWAQTDYTGTYYIGTVGYNAGTPTSNYYLCPTEGWCYYMATDDFTGTDNGMPFLTTYKCKTNGYHSGNASDAVWYVEKHPTLNYYYIKQASTGRYLTSNGTIRTTGNPDRMRVHLESVAPEDLDDKELFTIAEYTNKDSKTYLTISPKGVVGGAADRNWLVVNGGNVNNLKGASGKTGGPGNTADQYQNTKGIVGVYTQNDASAPFYLEKAISIDPPTITNNFTAENTFTITAAEGATIYYTTDGTTPTTETTTTGTTSVNITQTESLRVIKALAKATSDNFPTPVVTYILPVCERPAIKVGGGTVTITCSTAGAVIRYTTDGSPATASSTLYSGPFAKGDASTIRAVATKAGYVISSEAVFLPPTEVSSSDEITDMNGNYVLANGFSSSGSIGTSDNPFKGTIDGDWNQISLGYPLVAYADGAIIKNVIIDNVSISSGTNVGAICGEATGDTRIYNCGVLGGSVGGSNNVGGIVGLLDGRARVVNCYNYAKITSGSNCGGIVGYNNVASTSSNLQTMVMNCMFYGNITGGNAAPIYGGANIHNKYASADDTGLNNYCYFLYDEEKNPYVKTITSGNYHGALGAEERFLSRFEFFRMTLNSTRNLAAYYVTGDATQKGEIAKWVLDKSIAPYPILKVQGTYPSIVNPDAAHATTQTERNKGGLLGTLSVTISGTGSGAVFSAPTGASITTIGSLTLNITDKDEDNFNFNYKKVQLPYYNEVGTGNYTGDRVVTGWKITSITGGTSGSFTTDTYNYPSFNFVDRKCTNKDLYSVSGRVFAQGAYWEVPDGVTAITIEPYWAKAVYLSDAHYDMTYTITISGTGSGATATANKYGVTVCGSCPTVCNEQTVYTDLSTAMTNLGSNADHKVYDYAVVLVGNYHQAHNNALVGDGKPVTFMSADLDGDNEPDNTLFYYHNQRRSVSPIRFDFLNIPGIGMVKRTHDATMDPEPGILCPQGWFEITNTVFIRFGQFEYAGSNTFYKTTLAPLILQGGIYEQFVSCCRTNARNTNYLLIGGNAWFLNFANGCHTAQANTTPKVPVNVTGGDYTNFYLTGIYQPAAAEASENAECYIDGGRFTEVAGSGMQQIKGDVTWLINAADITSFYGGGINAAKPITGSISTTISNSYVDEFYGGPKFGDMDEETTVTTNATDCHFSKFFGAGYGGTAFNKVLPDKKYDSSSSANTRTWDSWVTAEYKRAYSSGNGGISTNYEYEFILHSDGNQTVARFYVDYASLSLASTRDVTSTLSGCTIGTFYGGGSLGAVNGDVNSTLTNCKVTGNAFGAGFSASVPTVEVWNANANLVPNPTYNRTANVFNNASVKTPKDNGQYVVYTWSKTHGSNANPFVDTEDGKHYIHTDVSLEGLGAVTGNVTLIIDGNTIADENGKVMTVGESVYGGGEESAVNGNTSVNINGGTITGSVFGGGEAGIVKDAVAVNMTGGLIQTDVYGGGALADTQTSNWDASASNWAAGKTSTSATTTVRLTGGQIVGNVYGGGLGNATTPAYVWGDVLVDLNGTTPIDGTTHKPSTTGTATTDATGCAVGQIFGGNNINGTPKGDVMVHIYATQNAAATQIANTSGDSPVTNAKVKERYDVTAVYGGGNQAAYDPVTPYNGTAGSKTQVIIEGCDKTSIETVYGGGNAAAVPETNVEIRGTYEIGYVFGGGNGKDDIAPGVPNPGADVGTLDHGETTYGTGNANTLLKGGLIHEAYGGSNTKGIIKGSINQITDPGDPEDPDCCELEVEKIVGAGKYADIDGDVNMTLSCQPSKKVNLLFAGADEANVNGNITLNITNGFFGKVFGGNNLGGAIKGKITVNVEETGCQPIKIDNLYLGSNEATYSIFGYYESDETHPVTGKKILKPRTSASDEHTPVTNPATDATHTFPYAQPELNIISCTYIGNVFSGGLGEGGKMYANPTVNINMKPGLYANDETVGVPAVMAELGLDASENPNKLGILENIYGGGDQANIEGNTTVNIATGKENDGTTSFSPARNGAYIVGNVFGGGNGVMDDLDLGKIIGNTHVIIGDGTDNANLHIKCSAYGGGNIGMVTGNTIVDVNNGIIGTNEKGGYRWGNVYGGGKGKIEIKSDGSSELVMNSTADLDAGLVKGNTNVTINGTETTTKILHNVYGGGAVGSVGTFTRDDNGMPTVCAANTGMATVTINGGAIGYDHEDTGMVNGSSRGWEGNPNGTGAFAYLNQLAWVNNTNVTIGSATSNDEDNGPSVYGSVYGGGENGHNFGNGVVTVNKGIVGYRSGTWDCGSIYGAGCGTDTYTIGEDPTEHHNPMAGVVRGTTTITVNGGHILRNVYGGGSMGSVGTYTYDANGLPTTCAAGTGNATININGGIIGLSGTDYGHVFGGPRGDLNETEFSASVRETSVNINTGADVLGSVFGGGEAGIVKESVVVNMNGGEVTQDVYGGGALANTNTDNWGTTTWATGKTAASNTTTVNLKGGKVNRNVYGGALGQTEREADPVNGIEALDDIEAKVYGNVLVELNNDAVVADDTKGCVVLGSIFGCNNLNGTPMGDVKVHIYKTQNVDASKIAGTDAEADADHQPKVLGRYDVAAVYGGGNQSAYVPADLENNKTEVIIDGCDRTSIQQVYGGGNAACTPATNVTINGTFEIDELFGGGNGLDDIQINGVDMPNPGANVGYKNYSEYYKEGGTWKVRDLADYDTKEKRAAATDIIYGTGKASVNIFGGTVHHVFGGSNTKGNVRLTAVTLLEELEGENCCPFQVDEAYGGGKSAEMDAEAQLLMACIPGLQAVYGGAEAADVRGNVTLNITNGTFDRVFGGNNISGTIGGSITINVEEIGCRPVKIGELYGGGNQAGYSIYGYNDDGTPKETGSRLYDDPQINVMSFTSIGDIYGGGYGNTAVMVGNPTVNVNVAYGKYYDEDLSIVLENTKIRDTYPIPSHAKGKMGAISNVFGGGNAAKVVGNTNVNIGTLSEVYVVKQVTAGSALEGCYTRNNDGTYSTATGSAVNGVTYYEKKNVLGADVRGNVYGGGNNAEVTGSGNVAIGKKILP